MFHLVACQWHHVLFIPSSCYNFRGNTRNTSESEEGSWQTTKPLIFTCNDGCFHDPTRLHDTIKLFCCYCSVFKTCTVKVLCVLIMCFSTKTPVTCLKSYNHIFSLTDKPRMYESVNILDFRGQLLDTRRLLLGCKVCCQCSRPGGSGFHVTLV